LVNANVLAHGSINSFITGKHFNQCKRLHPLLYLALEILHFETFIENNNIEVSDEIKNYLSEFKHQTSVSPTITHITLKGEHGKTPQFYMSYMNLIYHYFMLNRSVRTGNIELFKYILPKIANIFTFNQHNYIRYLVMYHKKLINVSNSFGLALKSSKRIVWS
jgi:hypothetical protein